LSFTIGQITQSGVDGWYGTLTRPPLNPPNVLFPVMWTILYALIAATGWYLWRRRHEAATRPLLLLFALYMAFNWSWSLLFFGLQSLTLGLIGILIVDALALLLIWRAWQPARPAAWLMIPPTLWTIFATYLNTGLLILN